MDTITEYQKDYLINELNKINISANLSLILINKMAIVLTPIELRYYTNTLNFIRSVSIDLKNAFNSYPLS